MPRGARTVISKFLLSLGLAAQFLFLVSGTGFSTQANSGASMQAGEDDSLQQGLKALQESRFEEALRFLTAAEGGQPANAQIRNLRGIVLVRLGRNSEAANEYREAIRLDPKFADGYKNLGFLEWTERHFESARDQLQRALELAPDDSFAHYYLGRVQLAAGLYESAFRELDRSGMTGPEDPEFLIEAANGYLALGRREKAREVIDRLEKMRLSDGEAAIVSRFLLSVGDNTKATELLRRLSERRNPAGPRWAQLDLALTFLMTGNYEQAAAQSRRLTETPQSTGATGEEAAAAWSIVGIAKAHLGQTDAAADALRQAAKLDPHREEHWLNLTRELMEANRLAEAISATQEALTSNPKSYALHLRLGAAYLSSDRYSESESAFRQLVAAGDPLPTSYVGLAQVLLRTGRAEEAVSELAAAGEKLGPNFLISYFQGLALDRAARPTEAISAFQDALRLNPDSSEAHLGLGKTELQVGQLNEAIAELQRCLQLSPANAQAQHLLSQAYRRAGDTEAALRYSHEPAEKEPAFQNLLGDFILPEWQSPAKQ